MMCMKVHWLLALTKCYMFQGDGMLYIEVDPFGADTWKLDPVVSLLKDGAVGVIPTDTVYVKPGIFSFDYFHLFSDLLLLQKFLFLLMT